MESSKLMKPLFHGNYFNRDGRRMRAVFVKSISNGTDGYRLSTSFYACMDKLIRAVAEEEEEP